MDTNKKPGSAGARESGSERVELSKKRSAAPKVRQIAPAATWATGSAGIRRGAEGVSSFRFPAKDDSPTYVQAKFKLRGRTIKAPPMLDNRSVLECCTIEQQWQDDLTCYVCEWPDGVRYAWWGTALPDDNQILAGYRNAWQRLQIERAQMEFLAEMLAMISEPTGGAV